LEGSKTDGAARQFKSVKLYNRAPTEVVSLAEQLYREQMKGQPDPSGGFASFVPETKGNRVIVIGSEPEIARAENIIRQIDPTVTRGDKDETRVLRLRNAQAQDLATLVEKSLNLEEQKVKLLVDPRSNSVVIRYPLTTKKMSTPRYPPTVVPGDRWNRMTRVTATARTPSRPATRNGAPTSGAARQAADGRRVRRARATSVLGAFMSGVPTAQRSRRAK